jgi:hypothetical protein
MNEQNKDLFDSYDESSVEVETTTITPKLVEAPASEGDELDITLGGYEYVKNPDVGESVELTMKTLTTKPGRELVNKTDNSTFWTGLKKRDDPDSKRVEYVIETVDRKSFSISSWNLLGAIKSNPDIVEKAIANKAAGKPLYEGIVIRITHVYNGKDSTTSVDDLMKLRGFGTREEAESHKKLVALAKKNGGIYKVEVLNK